MERFLLCFLISSLLAASTHGQGCEPITGSELGSADTFSGDGLIAQVYRTMMMGDTVVRLQGFGIACQVTAGSVGLYSQLSVVARYFVNNSMITLNRDQFEFQCNRGSWESSGGASFTSPADVEPFLDRFNFARSDCHQCISPTSLGSSLPGDNHCNPCRDCMGLNMCTSEDSCCNYFDRNGRCTVACTPPYAPLQNNTCACPQGMIEQSENVCVCPPGMIELPSGNGCGCPPGLTGTLCDVDIDFCAPEPCMNSGSCSSSRDGFTCTCPAGITGDRCQDDVNECAAAENPCQNGGTCVDTLGSYTCTCPGRWEGQNCENCGIVNCTICAIDGTACVQCAAGFFAVNNTCALIPGGRPPCPLEFCETCSVGNIACLECESGYIVGLNSLCVRGTPRDINLKDIEIIAIVVCCCIAGIFIFAMMLCFFVWCCTTSCESGNILYSSGKKMAVKKKKRIVHKKRKPNEYFEDNEDITTFVNENVEIGGEVGIENAEGGDLTLF